MRQFREIEDLASKATNQYVLVRALSKRVKHLKQGAPTLSDINPMEKPFEAAYTEFANGKIAYQLPDGGTHRAKPEDGLPGEDSSGSVTEGREPE